MVRTHDHDANLKCRQKVKAFPEAAPFSATMRLAIEPTRQKFPATVDAQASTSHPSALSVGLVARFCRISPSSITVGTFEQMLESTSMSSEASSTSKMES
jgi:hypothetical protein